MPFSESSPVRQAGDRRRDAQRGGLAPHPARRRGHEEEMIDASLRPFAAAATITLSMEGGRYRSSQCDFGAPSHGVHEVLAR